MTCFLIYLQFDDYVSSIVLDKNRSKIVGRFSVDNDIKYFLKFELLSVVKVLQTCQNCISYSWKPNKLLTLEIKI